MNKPRILFSIPTRHHVEIALDELEGIKELGYPAAQFYYAAKEGVRSKTGRLWVIIKNALALVKIANQFSPDIIYFNSRLEKLAGMRDFITIAICKIGYRRKVKFVIKSHGSDIDVLSDTAGIWGKWIMPYLKKNISGWLFLSTEEKRKVIETSYLSAECLYITKNIVRTDQFKHDAGFKAKQNIPADNQILLFVGRVIEEKGVYEVIKGFAQILEEYPALTLIMVGDGSSYDGIRQLALSLKISDKVIFTGFIPEQEVVNYYANCDILVFPTFFPEGFPMALFNSVAAGMAIVTTPTRAATDYLSEPENCLWVEPQNFYSVSNALKTLLNSHQLQEAMKQNNVIRGHEFSKTQVCVELADIFKSISNK